MPKKGKQSERKQSESEDSGPEEIVTIGAQAGNASMLNALEVRALSLSLSLFSSNSQEEWFFFPDWCSLWLSRFSSLLH
jgi:hypothetical protein